jgi:hypothetical protein
MSTNNLPKNEVHAEVFAYQDTLVAECVEIPVIVEAKTIEDLQTKMLKGVNGYFKAFPEKKDELNKRKSMITIPLTA